MIKESKKSDVKDNPGDAPNGEANEVGENVSVHNVNDPPVAQNPSIFSAYTRFKEEVKRTNSALGALVVTSQNSNYISNVLIALVPHLLVPQS